MVQLLNAIRAERVSTMNQNAWNPLSNVILQATELADIESARLIVQVHQIDSHVCTTLLKTKPFSFDYNLLLNFRLAQWGFGYFIAF